VNPRVAQSVARIAANSRNATCQLSGASRQLNSPRLTLDAAAASASIWISALAERASSARRSMLSWLPERGCLFTTYHHGVLHLGKRWYVLSAENDDAGTARGVRLDGPYADHKAAEATVEKHRGQS
jgi:hypothetical protein